MRTYFLNKNLCGRGKNAYFAGGMMNQAHHAAAVTYLIP
jgi:hypothetical protein